MNSSPASSSCQDLLQTADKVEELSAFEKLPTELHLEIYKHLLLAEKVRQPPNAHLVRHYHFEPSILCVNRKFHHEAWPILYRENKFITVSCNWDLIYGIMSGHEVAASSRSNPGAVARFKESVARLHINFPLKGPPFKNKTSGKVVKSFLLVAPELPNFVRMLRVLKALTLGQITKFNFRIDGTSEGPPSLATLQTIMDPFRALFVSTQSVKIWGAIDPSYSLSLKTIIDSEITWLRAAIWEMHDHAMTHKARGDWYFNLGNWTHALESYDSGKTLLDIALKNTPAPMFHLTMFTLDANIALTLVRKEDYHGVLEKTKLSIPPAMRLVPAQISLFTSRMLAYRAWALMLLGKTEESLQTLKEAAKTRPPTEAETAAGKVMAETLIPGTDGKEAEINKLFFALTNLEEQITVPLPPISPATTIAAERFVLRQLGYQGDYLLAIEETRPLRAEEMRKLRREVERYKATLAPGAPVKVMVSEGGRLVY